MSVAQSGSLLLTGSYHAGRQESGTLACVTWYCMRYELLKSAFWEEQIASPDPTVKLRPWI